MKRSYTAAIFLLAINFVNAQSDLVFKNRFVESEDRWVVFPKSKDSSFTYGFIYIDAAAGLTLHYQGKFTIDKNGKFLAQPIIDSVKGIFKVRLKPGNTLVAFIPPSRFEELDIQDPPDWLTVYKKDTTSPARLQRWGFYYNDFGMSEKALTYLEPGYKMAPDYKDMAVELAFAYNALNQFEKAIPVLNKAIELTPDYWYLYKELSYANLNLGKMQEAGDAALKGIAHAKANSFKAEMAFNMAYTYSEKRDKANFKKWADETLKWAAKGDQIYNSIKTLEARMN